MFNLKCNLNSTRIALIDASRHYTYRELDIITDQFANFLRMKQIKHGSHVAICLPRSIELIIAIMGILKVGGVYIPIAPCMPIERKDSMMKDANIGYVVANEHTSEMLSSKQPVVLMDKFLHEIEKYSTEKVNQPRNELDTAYIMYTSGSTGRQKGVMISHRSIVDLVVNNNYIEINCEDVLLQLSPPEFDASTFEIWGALLNGAALVIMPSGCPALGVIKEKIDNHKISKLFITTQLFNVMVDNHLDSLLKVKHILFGGEIASVLHVSKFISAASDKGCKLSNVYGPTECTTFSTSYLIESLAQLKDGVPIGKALSNVSTYILDENMKPVDENIIGELYIGGSGVCSGYIHDTKLTATKFINNPFSTLSEKLFKTGDLVVKLKDGNIQYVGRGDNQIKLRGFRLLPEEVESIICQFNGVRGAIVRLGELLPFKKKLVCYIVPFSENFNIRLLKEYMKVKLPDYMIPSYYLVLKEFPLNANGKIDHIKLITVYNDYINKQQSGVNSSYLLNEIEAEIIKVWKEELGVSTIGIHDDLFDMGGDSLSIINILEKLYNSSIEVFKYLRITDLFQFTSVHALSEYLSNIYYDKL